MIDLDRQQETKVLERAAELVDRGWCQYAIGFIGGKQLTMCTLPEADRVCALGALSLAMAEILGLDIQQVAKTSELRKEFVKARYALVEAVLAQLPPGENYGLSTWNDRYGRHGDEVAAVMRKAAAAHGD